jgi:hypothetical protein
MIERLQAASERFRSSALLTAAWRLGLFQNERDGRGMG